MAEGDVLAIIIALLISIEYLVWTPGVDPRSLVDELVGVLINELAADALRVLRFLLHDLHVVVSMQVL